MAAVEEGVIPTFLTMPEVVDTGRSERFRERRPRGNRGPLQRTSRVLMDLSLGVA